MNLLSIINYDWVRILTGESNIVKHRLEGLDGWNMLFYFSKVLCAPQLCPLCPY